MSSQNRQIIQRYGEKSGLVPRTRSSRTAASSIANLTARKNLEHLRARTRAQESKDGAIRASR